MRVLIITIIGIVFITSSCKNGNIKDVSEIDHLMKITDSLTQTVQRKFDDNSKRLYKLSDDSLKLDSLVSSSLPDSVGAYQYLKQSISDLDEIVAETQKEIDFATDQLRALKNEFLRGEIVESEYNSEISKLKNMVFFLEHRVDSNVLIINEEYEKFYKLHQDSVPL